MTTWRDPRGSPADLGDVLARGPAEIERVAAGGGSSADLTLIENLGGLVARTAMCGFGRRAPPPLLSGLHHLGHEFRTHLESGG